MCGGAFAQPMAITFVMIQELADVIKCTKFCGDRLRGFCATEGQSLGSPLGKRYGPYHSGKHYIPCCRIDEIMQIVQCLQKSANSTKDDNLATC
jgi:hypothetical protein